MDNNSEEVSVAAQSLAEVSYFLLKENKGGESGCSFVEAEMFIRKSIAIKIRIYGRIFISQLLVTTFCLLFCN